MPHEGQPGSRYPGLAFQAVENRRRIRLRRNQNRTPAGFFYRFANRSAKAEGNHSAGGANEASLVHKVKGEPCRARRQKGDHRRGVRRRLQHLDQGFWQTIGRPRLVKCLPARRLARLFQQGHEIAGKRGASSVINGPMIGVPMVQDQIGELFHVAASLMHLREPDLTAHGRGCRPDGEGRNVRPATPRSIGTHAIGTGERHRLRTIQVGRRARGQIDGHQGGDNGLKTGAFQILRERSRILQGARDDHPPARIWKSGCRCIGHGRLAVRAKKMC